MRPLLLVSLLVLAGCGSSVFVSGVLNSGTANAIGTVSFVHVSVIGNADGTKVTVTAVTLVNSGLSSTFDFCDDNSTQFPMNTSVTAVFTPGTPCSKLVSVRTR